MKFALRRRIAGLKAEAVAKELSRHAKRHGSITPRRLVDESRPVKAPLHKAFTWDDTKAADEFRLVQARSLIRAVRVIDDGGADLGSVYVNVTVMDDDEYGDVVAPGSAYVPMTSLVKSDDLYNDALARLRACLIAARRAVVDLSRYAKTSKDKATAKRVLNFMQKIEDLF